MKIAILSREPETYTTQRLLEAVQNQGHEGLIIDHAECYVNIQQNRPVVYYRGESLEGIDAIIPRIGQSITAYGAAIIRQFEVMRVYTLVSSLALVRSRDKLRAIQLLSRAGVGTPKTVFANATPDKSDLIDLVGGSPVVIKLLVGTQGNGVVLAETQQAASSVMDAFYNMGAEFLLQEFIAEAGGADVRVFIVDDKVVGAMMRQGPEGDFRSNLHQGGQAMPVELSVKERNVAIKAVQTLGLKVAGVDLIRSKRGPLVLEVNSSPGLEGIESVAGRHIAEDIVSYVVSQTGGKRRRDRVGA